MFHGKMGTKRDRNGMDLTEAEDIKKRWQEYTEELYRKDLHDQDNHHGVISHLEPDILECEVKCALGSITMNKASGGDGIPVELFQILKDDAKRVLHSICQQIGKTQQWPQDWKGSVFIPIPKKGNAKKCSNYHTIALISHTSKQCSKFSKPGFSNTWTVNFQMFKLFLEKAEEPEFKLRISAGSWKKQKSSRKTCIFALLTTLKPLMLWIKTNWKILKEMEIPDHFTCVLRNLYVSQEATVRTGCGTMDCCKIRKEYRKAVHCHPAYLSYIQSTSCEMLG